jgi:hypothetical protein
MNTKNTNQILGAYAPQKRPLFSTTAQIQERRMQLVSNAPPQNIVREVIRNRVRVD